MPYFVSLEGNLSVGKSSLLEAIKCENREIITIPEPVSKWQNFISSNSGIQYNFLNDIYEENKDKFQLQTMVLASFLEDYYNLQSEITSNKIIISDRCLASSIEVFCRAVLNMRQLDIIHYLAQQLYPLLPKPNIIFFLKASPDVYIKRIKLRNRIEESNLDYSYIQKIENLYLSWVFKKKCHPYYPKIVVLNCTESIDKLKNIVLSEIQHYITEAKGMGG